MILKLLAFPSRSRCPYVSLNPQNSLFRRLSSSLTDDVETFYRNLITSPNAQSVKQLLESSGFRLTNDFVDGVLKRFRFGHGNPLKALDFYRFTAARKGFYPSAISLDTMLYLLGRNRRFDLMWDVLIKTRRKAPSLVSSRTLKVVLARVANACSVRETVKSFRRLQKLVPGFGTTCFNALLSTLCEEKSMSDARNVYHFLKKEFVPDVHTFNILLSGWKSSEEAELLFEEIRELGVKPNVVSYNSLIDVYCKGREMEKAYRVIEKMQEEDVSPDVITYTSIIGGLGLVGQPDKARDVLKEMREYGCHPDVAAYNSVIRNYCICKRLSDANSLMEEMVAEGMRPDATTYGLFFRVFCGSNDLHSSQSLYERMMNDGCLPNTQSCMLLVRLFKKHEEVEMALKLWDDMVEKGFGSYTAVSDVLIDFLCDMGKLVEAEKCFLQMVEKFQRPSVASFKRIKVLMELANKHDALQNLSEKMAIFGHSMESSEYKENQTKQSHLQSLPS